MVLLQVMPGMKRGKKEREKKKVNETEQIILQFNFPSSLIMVPVSCLMDETATYSLSRLIPLL